MLYCIFCVSLYILPPEVVESVGNDPLRPVLGIWGLLGIGRDIAILFDKVKVVKVR